MCRVAILTPPGRGAVATIGLYGDAATSMVDRFFQAVAGRPLDRFAIDRIVFGQWPHDTTTGEEVVLTRRSKKYIEIHCHGGDAAAAAIVRSLVGSGCHQIAQNEWARQKEQDRLATDAKLALARSRTQRTASILLDQWKGALSRCVRQICRFIDRHEHEDAMAALRSLLVHKSLGLHLIEPWQVVLAGRANVGKSSLINAILGYQRSIVFDQPGTTRDLVTAATIIDGWPIELSDTAGLRISSDTIESAGVSIAEQMLRSADAIVLVLDQTSPWSDQDEQLVQRWPEAIVVMNKSDLPAAASANRIAAIDTSAKSGHGIKMLIRAISDHLVPVPPASGAPIPFTTAQVETFSDALKLLENNHTADAGKILDDLLLPTITDVNNPF